MTEEQKTSELPYSVSVRANVQGFDTLICMKGTVLSELLNRLPDLYAWLGKQTDNSTPTDETETKLCPLHQVPMTHYKQGKGEWWSHRVKNPDGTTTFCRGK